MVRNFDKENSLEEEYIGEEQTAEIFDAQNLEETTNDKDLSNLNSQNNEEFVPTGESLEMSHLVEDFEAENIKQKKKSKNAFFVDSSLFTFLIVFGIALITSIFTFQVWLTPIKVVGRSMQPSINLSVVSEKDENHCDIVYYNKDKSYKNNDVVIIENVDYNYVASEKDNNDVEFLIKRVIATPGQTIRFFIIDNPTSYEKPNQDEIYYNFVVLDSNGNDINLDQSYLAGEMHYSQNLANSGYYPFFSEIFNDLTKNTIKEYKVPENCYFVMGDNRNDSMDSRYFGAVKYEHICGSVKLTVAYGQNIFEAIWTKLKSIF